ncbi:universal stress protein [Kitasatospora herbaricolor]|uniref:universal stress protein n=1 Tax=Kitasatospora herbaricolor TaxID=68217 RepID=UPI00199C30B1|nr:universal stress protein [Kitasatospora herbaricolor]MDQ0312700.1 nucleotide-binding universal stress UspA family protein [Kitasatospora herbaricolor]GGV35199.1 universal stress protein [Kitasatospora herbaricolor]
MRRVEPVGQRTVVGVDGSPSSEQALRWAVTQARLTGDPVDAVICWTSPTVYERAPTSVDRELGHAAGKVLDQVVARTFGGVRPEEVRTTALPGNAAEVLVARSRGADLLVVGSRGRGGFGAALLGSVSQYCAQYAPCPVVVLRGGAG